MTLSRSILPGAVIGVAALAAAAPAPAANVGAEVHGGTLGAGASLDIGVTDNVGARIGFNRFSVSEEWQDGDLDYEADLELDSVHALLDWHPFGGVFRVTGGLMGNDNRVEGAANVQTGDQVGNVIASDSGRIGAEVTFDDAAPYLGIGWSTPPSNSGLSFSFDLGLLAQGSPDVELTEEQDIATVRESDLEEEEKNVEDEFEDFDTYPVVQAGIVYRF